MIRQIQHGQNILTAKCTNITQKVGRFSDILIGTLKEIKSVDFAFIDGHHDRDATIEYFNKIKPYLSKDAIVVFDDISWSDGMKEAWNIIQKDTIFKTFEDLKKIGICYLGDKQYDMV